MTTFQSVTVLMVCVADLAVVSAVAGRVAAGEDGGAGGARPAPPHPAPVHHKLYT